MVYLPRISNQVFSDAESAKNVELKKFDLHLDCQYGFYFNKAFTDISYDPDGYQNEQALSPLFKKHLEGVVDFCKSSFSTSADVIEVGCGKGTFLQLLSENGFKKLRGFDRAYQGNDPRIVKEYLSQKFSPCLRM